MAVWVFELFLGGFLEHFLTHTCTHTIRDRRTLLIFFSFNLKKKNKKTNASLRRTTRINLRKNADNVKRFSAALISIFETCQ